MNTLFAEQENALQSAEISTTFYINEVPLFVENELQRLYAHIHASLPFIETFHSPGQISTYVARRGGTPIAVLLFRLGRRSIDILAKMIRLDSMELQRFAACAFDQFPSVGVISFKSLQANLSGFPYPIQRGHSREDLVVTLPSTVEDYNARLGKSTRKNLKRRRAQLEQDFPSVRFESYEKEDIDENIILHLIKLSELRVSAKKFNFSIDSHYARGMLDLARLYGVLDVIWIDGRLYSGSLSYRIGESQFGEIIAHDELYNDYSPGMLCYYWAVCESINKGVKKFHMGSGRLEYKVSLLAVQQNMEQVEIYRSPVAVVLNYDWVMRSKSKALVLKLRKWLRSHEDSSPVRLLLASRAAMRGMFIRR